MDQKSMFYVSLIFFINYFCYQLKYNFKSFWIKITVPLKSEENYLIVKVCLKPKCKILAVILFW